MQKNWMIKIGLEWNEGESQQLAQEMFKRIYDMKFMPPGRGLWSMGTKITDERALFAALNNCAFVSTEGIDKLESPAEPFKFLMDCSMLGVGVGFNTKCKDHLFIPGIDNTLNTYVHVIPDSREGWVTSLQILLDAYFLKQARPIFDYSLIRKKNELIKGFGGISSGPDPLIQLHSSIEYILVKGTGRQITTRIIVDIMNLIGKCVISGNVRRTAEIAFGEYDDEEYIDLKNYTKNPERGEFGWTSNNSIFAKLGMDYKPIAKRIIDNGEPGFAWLDNMRNYGRMNGIMDTRDHKAEGGNPCVSGDTWTMTINGPRQVKNLLTENQQILIINGAPYNTTDAGFFSTGIKPVFKVHTNEGFELIATGNHLIKTIDKDWVPVESLKHGDKILIMNHKNIIKWSGTGTIESGNAVGLYTLNILETIKDIYPSYDDKTISKMIFHNCIEENSYNFYIGFLNTLFSRSIQDIDDDSILLLRQRYSVLQVLQRMLLRIGVYSSVIHDISNIHDTSNNSNYGLYIKNNAISIYMSIINNVTNDTNVTNVTNNIFTNDNTLLYATIADVEEWGKEQVYDCTVPQISAFDANGIYVHNCLEQTLESYELCCLVETFPNHHETLEDYKETLKYAFLYAKTVTLGATHWPKTNTVMARNRRIGCSMTGIAQFLSTKGMHELKTWCNEGYDSLLDYDKLYSDKFAIPRSIKITSIKPSGTVSLLAGATPGMHFPESRFYIRRVRIDKSSELVDTLRQAGYFIEPAHEDPKNTVVASFPIDIGLNVKTIKDVSAWEQMELASFLQQYWADNQVSCTITFDKNKEGSQIASMLEYFQYRLKGVSLLPKLTNLKVYPQMPYEEINESTYKNMMIGIKPLYFDTTNKSIDKVNEESPDKFCDSSSCQL